MMKRLAILLLCFAVPAVPQEFKLTHYFQSASQAKLYLLVFVSHRSVGPGICPGGETLLKWFDSPQDAENWLASQEAKVHTSNPDDLIDVIGLYQAKSVVLSQEQSGTTQKPVTEMKEVPRLKWKVKQ